MKTTQLLVVASCALAFGTANAQQPPAGPVKVPLGTVSAEMLLSKVVVSDLQKSLDFYTKIIGLKRARPLNIKDLPPIPDPEQTAFIEVGMNFSGSFADAFFDIVHERGKTPSRESADLTVIGFKVPDAAAVVARAKQAGYEVLRDAPAVGPGEMSIGMLRDPDGYRIEILQAANYPARSK